MKRFISMLLAALMLITCASAHAETTEYRELGFAIDFSAIQEQSENYPFLKNFGISSQEPFVSAMAVVYTNLPGDAVETIEGMMNETEDEAEYDEYDELLSAVTASIGQIIVTNAKDLAEVGLDASMLEEYEVNEFGTLGDYHYFFIATPVDDLLSIFDGVEDTGDYGISPQEMKAAALANIDKVRSELLKQLQSAELHEPVNAANAFIGQTIAFESVDLDGNAVSSADLFRNNRITMVNLWGSWCVNCINEMGELAEIHKRMREKGCGIVGVEYERDSIDAVADTARKVLEDNGVTYPNVWIPESNPIFAQAGGFPFSLFVDSEGKILTYPIKGAPRDAISVYESTFEKLLAGETIDESTDTGATENESGTYRVFVYDTDGNPVEGAVVQLCDESSCSFQQTDADGAATFQVEAPKVYDVHVLVAPEGYQSSDEIYKTLDTFSDVNVFLEKA